MSLVPNGAGVPNASGTLDRKLVGDADVAPAGTSVLVSVVVDLRWPVVKVLKKAGREIE